MANGRNASQNLTAGTYDMDFELSGTSGLLAEAPMQHTIEIVPDAITALTPLVFQLDATGGLSLLFTTGKPGGNCGAIVDNGAAIIATTITMTHNSDITCEPITLAIAAGATKPAASYTINCAAPTDGPCIEDDQIVTASGVPADSYTIRVRGKTALPGCWRNDDAIGVPPLGKVLTDTLNLGHQTSTTGC